MPDEYWRADRESIPVVPLRDRLVSMLRAACAVIALACAALGALPTTAHAVDATTDPTDTTQDSVVPASNDFLDLERSLDECISSNPPPGCGRVPTGPGDRGGWQQLALFGIMFAGMAVIFWRISLAVRRRDDTSTNEPTP